MSNYGKFLTYFTSALIVSNRYIDAVKVIETYGYKHDTDFLILANMHKLHSVLLFKEKDYQGALEQIDDAIEMFTLSKSNSGLSISYLFRAYIKFYEGKNREHSWNDSQSDDSKIEDNLYKDDFEEFIKFYKNSGHLSKTLLT